MTVLLNRSFVRLWTFSKPRQVYSLQYCKPLRRQTQPILYFSCAFERSWWAVGCSIKSGEETLEQPIHYLRGSNSTVRQATPPKARQQTAPGFIQFRAYSLTGTPYPICPGVRWAYLFSRGNFNYKLHVASNLVTFFLQDLPPTVHVSRRGQFCYNWARGSMRRLSW